MAKACLPTKNYGKLFKENNYDTQKVQIELVQLKVKSYYEAKK